MYDVVIFFVRETGNMEIWDAYNEDGSLAGCDLSRGEPIPDGLYHLACEILVKHTDESYLLTQRDFLKADFPGMFEATAGGSALKGETPLRAAIRELKEETGIAANELTPICDPFIEGKGLYYCFLCVTDCSKTSIILQDGETISYSWLARDEFLDFVNSDKCIPSQKDRLLSYLSSE